MNCDIMFRGALIVDGSGRSGFSADLAVAGDEIVAIGAGLDTEAADTVDASGCVLAPGFIDIHTHDDAALLGQPDMAAKVSQGVTTVVVGNCGISLAPRPLAGRDGPVPPLDLLGDVEAFRFARFADYRRAIEDAPPAVNVVALVGHTTLRARAMKTFDRPATPAEIRAMRDDLAEALEAGAAGLSTGLAYPPARASSTDEIVALAGKAAAAGALHTTHMRDESSGVVSAVAETIDIARRTGVRTLISHHKCCGASNWGLSRTTLAMIEEARENLSVDLDVYPYTASSTVLLESFAQDSSRVQVSWSDPHPDAAGRDLADLAREWSVDELTALDRLRPGGAIYHQMCDVDLERILAYPPTVVGSDGLPRDRRPHPRLWGAFPRIIARYVRQRGLMRLEEAVAKMTGRTAAILGLTDRGVLAPGRKADLVLFDPATIEDTATYEHPASPARGIRVVIANGRPVWRNGSATGEKPGRFIAPCGVEPV